MQPKVSKFQRILSQVLIVLFISISFGLVSPQSVIALPKFEGKLTKQVEEILSNETLLKDANQFLKMSQTEVCQVYTDSLAGQDKSKWLALKASAESAASVVGAISAASTAGAGNLAGYAGINGLIAHVGLGGVTTIIAHLLGHRVAGAAATSVVTAAMGGPIVMGSILVVSAGLTTFGVYKAGKLVTKELGDWAEATCIGVN